LKRTSAVTKTLPHVFKRLDGSYYDFGSTKTLSKSLGLSR
jgi:hypothetical protein